MKLTSALKRKAGLIPTEDDECFDLVAYLQERQDNGTVCLFTHIPNETFTKYWSVKTKNRMLGVRKGFPDYVVILPTGIKIIEMKRSRGGVVSAEQSEWIELLNHFGIETKVCKGFIEAKDFLEDLA